MKMNGHKYKWNSMMINPYPGKFIAFEGIDGCGKSTQAKLLKNNLKELGYEIVLTCEPYANIELKNNPNLKPLDRQGMFIDDRLVHLTDIIIPDLKDEKIVITDRYFLSTIAYGMSEDIEQKNLIELHERILGDKFIIPDIIIMIDASTETAMNHLKKKGEIKGYFEKQDRLGKIRNAYINIYANKFYKNNGVKMEWIDGNRFIKDVSRDILKRSLEILK